ncbi:hypothetical protein ACI2U9_17640 [Ralstonia nicotianae]
MTTFVKKQEIFRGDIAYQVVRPLENNVVQLENVATGELSIHQHCELLEEYRRGYLRVALARQHEGGKQNKKSGSPMDMSHLKESAQVETRRHVAYLIELEKKEAFGLCERPSGSSLDGRVGGTGTTQRAWARAVVSSLSSDGRTVLAQCMANRTSRMHVAWVLVG